MKMNSFEEASRRSVHVRVPQMPHSDLVVAVPTTQPLQGVG